LFADDTFYLLKQNRDDQQMHASSINTIWKKRKSQ